MILYLFACFILALGIGLDVILATLSRVRYLTPALGWTWVRRIVTTHIVFPMIGYYGFIELFHLFPSLRVLLGLLAFGLIVLFLYKAVSGWFDTEKDIDSSAPFSWLVVLSVSWDALFSGPAKSAQAIGWNSTEIAFSFVISGAIVGVLATLAVRAALLLARHSHVILRHSVRAYTRLHLGMMFLEFVVFAYFGILALLRYTFHATLPDWQVGCVALGLGLVLFVIIYRPLLPILERHVRGELPAPGVCHADPRAG